VTRRSRVGPHVSLAPLETVPEKTLPVHKPPSAERHAEHRLLGLRASGRTKRDEVLAVGCGDLACNVDQGGAERIAGAQSHARRVVWRCGTEELCTVALRQLGRGEMEDNRLEKGARRRKPALHHSNRQLCALKFKVIVGHADAQRREPAPAQSLVSELTGTRGAWIDRA
jgi:hypothetical protein